MWNMFNNFLGNTNRELLEAAKLGDVQACLDAIHRGADPECVNEEKCTPLMVAVTFGHAELVKRLLEKNANINTVNGEDETVFEVGAKGRNAETMQALLGSCSSLSGERYQNLIEIALLNKKAEIANVLLPFFIQKIQKNTANSMSGTLNMWLNQEAAKPEIHIDTLKVLMQHGADINNFTFGFNPLHAAISHGEKEKILVLEKLGADLNVTNKHGDNVLHCAVEEKQFEVLQYLLKLNRINPNSKNHHNQTPLDIVRKKLADNKKDLRAKEKATEEINIELHTLLHNILSHSNDSTVSEPERRKAENRLSFAQSYLKDKQKLWDEETLLIQFKNLLKAEERCFIETLLPLAMDHSQQNNPEISNNVLMSCLLPEPTQSMFQVNDPLNLLGVPSPQMYPSLVNVNNNMSNIDNVRHDNFATPLYQQHNENRKRLLSREDQVGTEPPNKRRKVIESLI